MFKHKETPYFILLEMKQKSFNASPYCLQLLAENSGLT